MASVCLCLLRESCLCFVKRRVVWSLGMFWYLIEWLISDWSIDGSVDWSIAYHWALSDVLVICSTHYVLVKYSPPQKKNHTHTPTHTTRINFTLVIQTYLVKSNQRCDRNLRSSAGLWWTLRWLPISWYTDRRWRHSARNVPPINRTHTHTPTHTHPTRISTLPYLQKVLRVS